MSKTHSTPKVPDREKQLSLGFTLSDLVRKHVLQNRDTTAPKAPSLKNLPPEIKPQPVNKQRDVTRTVEAKKGLQDKTAEAAKKAHVALEGALSRWEAAIQWRENNKEMLDKKAEAFYSRI